MSGQPHPANQAVRRPVADRGVSGGLSWLNALDPPVCGPSCSRVLVHAASWWKPA